MSNNVCRCGHETKEHHGGGCGHGNHTQGYCGCMQTREELFVYELAQLRADNAVMKEALVWIDRYYGGDAYFKAHYALAKVTHEQ